VRLRCPGGCSLDEPIYVDQPLRVENDGFQACNRVPGCVGNVVIGDYRMTPHSGASNEAHFALQGGNPVPESLDLIGPLVLAVGFEHVRLRTSLSAVMLRPAHPCRPASGGIAHTGRYLINLSLVVLPNLLAVLFEDHEGLPEIGLRPVLHEEVFEVLLRHEARGVLDLRPRCWARVAGRRSPASATRWSSSKAVSRRSRLCDDRIRQVLRCGRVGGLSQRHLPSSAGAGFLVPAARQPAAVGGSGLRSSDRPAPEGVAARRLRWRVHRQGRAA
jgi:hypothetical protein